MADEKPSPEMCKFMADVDREVGQKPQPKSAMAQCKNWPYNHIAQFVIIDEKTGKPAEVKFVYCITFGDGKEIAGIADKNKTETKVVRSPAEVAVEMLHPIQLEIGV